MPDVFLVNLAPGDFKVTTASFENNSDIFVREEIKLSRSHERNSTSRTRANAQRVRASAARRKCTPVSIMRLHMQYVLVL